MIDKLTADYLTKAVSEFHQKQVEANHKPLSYYVALRLALINSMT